MPVALLCFVDGATCCECEIGIPSKGVGHYSWMRFDAEIALEGRRVNFCFERLMLGMGLSGFKSTCCRF